ncbi:hypothetical protein FACS1894113_0660 [Alphaproteobacteria bacterium]|nr:hypothetical protein FACS1894113_0660 [Alphaproteobacteria bacterium]
MKGKFLSKVLFTGLIACSTVCSSYATDIETSIVSSCVIEQLKANKKDLPVVNFDAIEKVFSKVSGTDPGKEFVKVTGDIEFIINAVNARSARNVSVFSADLAELAKSICDLLQFVNIFYKLGEACLGRDIDKITALLLNGRFFCNHRKYNNLERYFTDWHSIFCNELSSDFVSGREVDKVSIDVVKLHDLLCVSSRNLEQVSKLLLDSSTRMECLNRIFACYSMEDVRESLCEKLIEVSNIAGSCKSQADNLKAKTTERIKSYNELYSH